MDQTTKTIVISLLIALGGWLATTHWIKSHQKLTDQHKRMLIVPLWFPWMGFAMGAPVMNGQISWLEAVKAVVSFSVGMLVCVVMTRRKARRS